MYKLVNFKNLKWLLLSYMELSGKTSNGHNVTLAPLSHKIDDNSLIVQVSWRVNSNTSIINSYHYCNACICIAHLLME